MPTTMQALGYDGQNSITASPTAGNAGTVTLPAVPGKYHYISAIHVQRSATAALAGTATLAITTTNIATAPQWQVGNAMAAGGTQLDIQAAFNPPLKSAVAGTATTLVMPAPGAAVLWNGTVFYMIGD